MAAEEGVGVGPLPEVISVQMGTASGARGETLGSGSITGTSSMEIGEETIDEAGGGRISKSQSIPNHSQPRRA
jgi:hypothetical protein